MWTARPPEHVEIKEAFGREEAAGLLFSCRLRVTVLLVIGAWLAYSVPMPRVLYYFGLIALFIILGIVPLVLRRYGRWGVGAIAVIALLDAGLLAYTLLAPNPFVETTWPPQMMLRFHNFLYFFVFLAGAALSYSPGHVLWSGSAAAAAWSIGVYLIWARPDTVVGSGSGPTDPDGFLSPYFVNVVTWQNEVVLMMIVAALLAAAVWRSRRLVLRQVAAEQARSNLARYFSPNLVDRLARAGRPFDEASTQNAAVLFVDIIGFTSIAEGMPPEKVIALLRGFHQRMCRVVFAHHGTLDKYIGDAVLATFGTPKPGDRDATNALNCALGMLREIERWNAKRALRGAAPLQVGIGIHYGPVVAGNIGDERRLEFTVIGDVVNVASRIERLTRQYDTPLIVSGDLVAAVRQEGHDDNLLAGFTESTSSEVRGRRAPVAIWQYDAGAGQSAAPAIIA
ncbi:adenylate/guanylate cyclase domain-containing protein [Pelagibius sp. 7325]|uniref:adenylate/guanylate cyclase domain-containing protein n=1 Tax=Pelagibius sp. 7325 TaxID=3131994 RepID=UPI0030EEF07E